MHIRKNSEPSTFVLIKMIVSNQAIFSNVSFHWNEEDKNESDGTWINDNESESSVGCLGMKNKWQLIFQLNFQTKK